MNHLYDIKIYSPECASNTNGSIDITDNTRGDSLSFTWLNLPVTAKILNEGKTVLNLDCGKYFVEIYDLDTRLQKKETIEIKCKDVLSLDMINIDSLNCHDDLGELNATWSGGTPPYIISINSEKIISHNKFLTYNIRSNSNYTLTIKDNNNCSVSRNNIVKHIDPLRISVKWTPIDHHGAKCPNLSFDVKGGKQPYTFALFDESSDTKPIIVNQNIIENKLPSGNYTIKVTDSNDCMGEKTFFISEPPPIRATIRSSADYHTESFFPAESFNKVYNMLLIPKEKHNISTFYKNLINNELKLKHKTKISQQNITLDHGSVIINDINYMYFYINPGLNGIQKATSELIVGDKKINLNHSCEFSNQSKLLIGSVILDKNYEYLFHDKDLVEIFNDQKSIQAEISYSYTKTGLYLSPNISTIVNFLPNHTDDILNILNNQKNLQIKCLTTKSNSKKGEISGYVSGGDKDSIRIELLDSNNQITYHNIHDHHIHIKDLRYGSYKLKILDDHNVCEDINGQIINDGFYNIDIHSSFEEEQVVSQQLNINKYHIPSHMLNNYNNIPNKLLFTSPEFKNGVLINISPSEACFEIREDGKLIIQDCGYQTVDLDYGKYNITVFYDDYITTNKDFFINGDKDLVTVLLEREV